MLAQVDEEDKFYLENTFYFKECIDLMQLLQGKYKVVIDLEPTISSKSSDSDDAAKDANEVVFGKKICEIKVSEIQESWPSLFIDKDAKIFKKSLLNKLMKA